MRGVTAGTWRRRGRRAAIVLALGVAAGVFGAPRADSGGRAARIAACAAADAAESAADSTNASLARGLAAVRDLVARKERAAADSLGRAVLSEIEGRAGVDSLLYVDLVNAIARARVNSALWKTPGTREMLESAVAIGERHAGRDDLRVAESLACLARLHYNESDYPAAIEISGRALAIREAKLPENSGEIASSVSLLASAEHLRGNLRKAREHHERVVRIDEALYGNEAPEYAYALNNLGVSLSHLGEDAEAIAVFERAIAIYEKSLGPDNARQVWPLVNLGECFRQTGEFAKGIEALERAAAIAEKSYGPENSEVGSALINLGLLEIVDGRAHDAQRHLERALAIKLATDGPESPMVAVTLLGLGHLLGPMGETARAESLLQRGMELCAKTYGPQNLRMDSFRINLAALAYARGDTARARALYDDALASRERNFGPAHPQLGEVLAPYSVYLALAGSDARALDLALHAEAIGREHLRLAAQSGTEMSALRYAAVRPSGLDLALGMIARGRFAGPAVERVWDALVASRALVLEEMATRRELIGATSDPALRDVWDRFAAASHDLARLLLDEGAAAAPDSLRARIDGARAARDAAERELAHASAGYRRGARSREVTLRDVLAALPPGSALVSYARYRDLLARGGPETLLDIAWDPRASGAPRDVALIARGGSIASVIDLGDADANDRLVARWLDESSRGTLVRGRDDGAALSAYVAAGDALRRAIWDPLAPHLAGASRVFIVPDGSLALVSFAALPVSAGGPGRGDGAGVRFLLDGAHTIHLLNSEREAVEWDNRGAEGAGLLAMGGAAFDVAGAEAFGSGFESAAAESPSTAQDAAARGGASDDDGARALFRGHRALCAQFRDVRFRELPASRGEAEEVARLWSAAGARAPADSGGAARAAAATVLTGANASEAAVKQLGRGRRVIHIASHGFFLRADCEVEGADGGGGDGTRGIGGLSPAASAGARPPAPRDTTGGAPDEAPRAARARVPARTAAANPLRLSGLALAGANLRASADPSREDGVLTAEEVAALDLRGVDWVVLSACDTGVGDLAIGGGVFGLRRSFQLAGARTVVSSLWAVRDDVASRWMGALYDERWRGGADTAAAVRAASRRLLESRRAAGESVHPFYWGGFIATGDWR